MNFQIHFYLYTFLIWITSILKKDTIIKNKMLIIKSKLNIINNLNERNLGLINWLENQKEELFEKGPAGKWTTGEHISHLITSSKMLNQGLNMPKLVLKATFGKNNRTERTYEEIVKKYKEKLAAGGTAPNRFAPKPVSKNEKQKLINLLQVEHQKMVDNINKWKEADMEVYLLPHPLLGKMTIREMLLFTIYHIEHHFINLKANY